MEQAYRAQDRFVALADSRETPLDAVAMENEELVRQWIDLQSSLSKLSQQVVAAEDRLEETTLDFRDVSAKLKHYGLTPTIGLLLRNKSEQLDRWQAGDSQTVSRHLGLEDIRQQQLTLELMNDDGSFPDQHAADRIAAAGIRVSDSQLSSLQRRISDLYSQRYQWVVQLRDAYAEYHHSVGALDSATRGFAELSTLYRRLIRKQTTWIRSGTVIRISDFGKLGNGLAALFAARRSESIGVTIGQKWQSDRGGVFMLLLWIAMLGFVRWRCKSWLLKIGHGTALKHREKEIQTAIAGLLTVATALCLPAMLYLVSRWLGHGIVSTRALHAASAAAAASLVALAIELPRQSLRNFGLLDRHVEIELPTRARAMNYLTIMGLVMVLATYYITLSGLTDRGAWRDSLSRFGFMAAMFLIAITAHRTMRVVGGFAEPIVAKFGGSVIHRGRFILYCIAVAAPLIMIVLSGLGYAHAAAELLQRFLITWIVALVATMVWPGVVAVSSHTWRMLTGTLGPVKQYDEYGQLEPAGATLDDGHVSGVLANHYLELKHQLAFLCQCGFVIFGILSVGWLWVDVIPMAEISNPVLWTVNQDVAVASDDGLAATRWVSEPRPITVLNVLLAAATMFVAFQVAKLLPALFDALVLQRVSFDEAMEHFVLVLGRCLLFGVGMLIALRLIGIRWQTVQWLAVGLMVGLGFGMQDMIRNLLGGIIVLFEKPAKLGDRISVGQLTGRVAMQRLRTTVLSDDEGREVIVPNKNFVSDEVINWMGAGRLRVVPIEVSVNRDERPADVCRTLTELMLKQPEVLLSPQPQATLVCVGQSAQRIELRAWIEDGPNATRFRDSLLKTVRKTLRDAELLSAKQPRQPSLETGGGGNDDEDWMRAA